MKSVRYTRRASADFDDIADYTARVWGAVQAKKYIAELRGHIQKIAAGGAYSQPLDVQRENIFKSKINRHLVIFEISQTQISVLRVLHEAMDVPRLV
jgi:toxin ParE1/3/4